MADPAKKSTANTELFIGTLKAPIGLFGTNAKPDKTQEFDTAGPNGGVLKYEQRGVETPMDEQTETAPDAPVRDALTGDAIAKDPGSDAPPIEEAFPPAAAASNGAALVEGEFRQVLVEEGTGEVVEPEDVRKGVRLEDGRFIDCTDQLAAIVNRTKLDRMEVVATIDATQIRRERVTGSYYIGAQDPKATPVLRLLFESLKTRREVAVVKYTTRSRQQLGVIAPHAKTGTLVLLSLVWSEDWRAAPAKATAIAKVSVTDRQVGVMSQILAAMHDTVDVLDTLRDDAIKLREELKVRAEAGEMAEVVEPLPAPVEAQDVEAQLEASLAAVKAGKL